MPNLKCVAFPLVLFFSVVLHAVAQKTSGSLAVESGDGLNLAQIIQRLPAAKPDTNTVNLLIRESHLYWLQETNQNNFLDSSRIAAETALNLSNRLRYIEGSNEANFMICRAYVEKGDINSAVKLSSKVYGEERVRLLLIISEHFVFSHESPTPIDKGYPFIIDAINTSKSSGSSSWYYQSLLLLGKYYFLKGDFVKGKYAILQIINSCDKASDFADEAHYWSELGNYMPQTDSTIQDIVQIHGMAVKFYLKAGNKKEAAYALRDKATAHLIAGQLDSAEKDGLEVFSMLDELKLKPSFNTYLNMADIYQNIGNFPKALNYTLAAIKLFEPLNGKKKWSADRELGIIYDQLNQPEKALLYLKPAFDYALSINDEETFYWKYRQTEDQIKTADAKNALNQLNNLTAKFKPVTANQKEIVAATYGDLYQSLNSYKKAEGYYLEMIKYDKVALEKLKQAIGFGNNIIGSEAFYKIGRFYTERKSYSLARPYLINAMKGRNSSSVEERSNIEFTLFKADSALRNFVSAIRHFEHSKNVKDSMFNATKSKQLSELEIQYQTGQREKSFLALKNKSMLQKEELERGHLERMLTLAGTGCLLIVFGLVYNGYRNKKKSNITLEIKQREINFQNESLRTLLVEKDNFLTEKDWLLKEVHHRVKNNLQIVMSLLSSQSAYLKNTAALDAIRESQNRVRVIALLHQRLYKSSNVAHINMPAYVSDLVGYLADCFDTPGRRIRIEQIVEDLSLDLAQAVPVGLILNEAITNSIKYAFDKEGGEIIIAIEQVGNDGLIMLISDNGKGLPEDFDLKETSSLGMEMMKALSKQLGGEFQARKKSGLQISVEFLIEREAKRNFNTAF